MRNSKFHQIARFAVVASAVVTLTIALLVLHPSVATTSNPQSSAPNQTADPWTSAQTVSPAVLAKELAGAKSSHSPTIVCVGFRTLYEGAHVPGSSFHGPAATSAGLADLKKWAEPLPRSTNIVVYCGCCPLAHCPNVRPAFTTLRDMGFTHLRLLLIPKDLATDWIERGYPVARGK